MEKHINQQHNISDESDNIVLATLQLQKDMFQCPACSDVFSYMSELWEHTTENHWDLIAEEKYEESIINDKCENCQQGFEHFSMLKKHKESCNSKANGQKDFKCGECEKLFGCERELVEHAHPTTRGTSASVYQTNDMGQPLVEELLHSENVNDHTSNETPIQNTSEPLELVNHCSMCDQAYSSNSLLEDHIKYMHTMQDDMKLQQEIGDDTLSRSQCPYCTNSYIWSSYLKVSQQSLE